MENFNKNMHGLGSNRSVIRELFEFGKKRMAEVGEDKVYDFSLGNPNVPAPECVKTALQELIAYPDSTLIHGYTSAQGDLGVRKTVADNINTRFGVGVGADNIYMTCGAAASLCITLRALNSSNDDFIIFAPYFPEYEVFIKSAGGNAISVPFCEKDFQIDFIAFEKALTSNTKAVIVNSPNNPCGVVYSPKTIEKLTSLLSAYSEKYGHPIYLIADEPYRELVYDKIEVPYLMNYYNDTIVCYSYSKSLSLPGERIGYIAVNPKAADARDIYAAICGAGRALGYVCAPSIFQRVVQKCIDAKPDIDAYRKNRDLLYNSLTEIGYDCVYPDGAFYLFVKSLEPDANSFADRAKQLGLLLVPGDDFYAKGYVRIAYCVSYDMISRSIPAFRQLYSQYKG